MKFGNHKDINPQVTLNNIRNILSNIGITVFEQYWDTFGNDNYSLRIVDSEMPFIGTNGKGVTREFALASAYAEYMERLQNGILYLRKFGLMNEQFMFPDTKFLTLNEIQKQSCHFYKYFFKDSDTSYTIDKNSLKCVPFYNLSNDIIEYIPEDLLISACSSNGMCAGNTAEEAISQGISEILERYIIRMVYFNKEFVAPVIEEKYYRNLDVYKIIKSFKKMGYNIIVKDCSMGGKYPVLCTILINRSLNKYLVGFASDVLFENALQRCLTEISQGFSDKTLSYKLHDLELNESKITLDYFENKESEIFYNYRMYLINKSGKLPKNIFNIEKGSRNFKSIFLDTFISNKHSLKYLLNILTNNDKKIFIRDVSFLSFPSYYIYIPGMSEMWAWDIKNNINNHLKSYMQNNLLDLLRIKSLSKKELLILSNHIHLLENDPYSNKSIDKNMSNLFPLLYAKENSDYNITNTRVLLCMFFIKLKKYKKAYYHLNKFLKNKYNIKKKDYFSCVLLYLNMKSKEIDIEDILKTMECYYGTIIANKVLSDMSKTENILDNYNFPNCGKCNKCSFISDCYYSVWLKRINTLNMAMKKKFPNQNLLREVFLDI